MDKVHWLWRDMHVRIILAEQVYGKIVASIEYSDVV